jgi:hypothetical protein
LNARIIGSTTLSVDAVVLRPKGKTMAKALSEKELPRGCDGACVVTSRICDECAGGGETQHLMLSPETVECMECGHISLLCEI